MTGNKAYLSDYEDYNRGFVAFGSDPKGGKIMGKDLLTKGFDVIRFNILMGKSFSGNVTPLFPSMLAQPTKDEGAVLEKPSKTQPTPSPPHPSADHLTHLLDLHLLFLFLIPFQRVLAGIMEVSHSVIDVGN
ncbi:hypothetical protein Tco_0176622 [Tanacetum coccineum]